MHFSDLFSTSKPLIACIHLLPLPGSPNYQGKMSTIYETALKETELFKKYPIDGLIVENFRDAPFYPDRIPSETVAALAAVTREIVKAVDIPVGVNALRNDAPAAMAIATATEAHFIRVNVHLGAVVADQGIIQGNAHATLRLRASLRSNTLIFADVGVKHAAPLVNRGIGAEAKELTERGLVDALIVSGAFTGAEANLQDVESVRKNTHLPLLLGSGATPQNIGNIYHLLDGLIVGSYFKKEGQANNPVEENRVHDFCQHLQSL